MSWFDSPLIAWKRSTQLTLAEVKIVEDLFVSLMSYVNVMEQLYPYEEGLRSARGIPGDQKTIRYLKTYFELENFIVTSRTPIITENITTDVLRQQLLAERYIERLPLPFQVVFLTDTEQLLALYSMAAKNLLSFVETYMSRGIGAVILQRVYDKALLVTSVPKHEQTLEALVQRLRDNHDEDLFQTFRSLYWAFYVEIRHAFGDAVTIALARRDYEFFVMAYGIELGKKFLDILPEGVLEAERVTFMSREELENEVQERTGELQNFNETLERRVAERTKELETANQRLRELDKVKTEFISVAAHQFRTPLAAIKWTLSTVLEGEADNLNAEQKALLMKGYESTDRLIHLINQMLVVTRIESGKVQYEYVPIRIENLIDSVLLDFVGHAAQVGVTVDFHRPTAPLPYIQADPEKLRSVVQNLVENSLQYTRKGGHVELFAEQDGNTIKVRVKDNGIGIPEKQQSGIFNKFFRAENATKERADGSGLGLFVIKKSSKLTGGQSVL
jgi:signal transduction histidine kinase